MNDEEMLTRGLKALAAEMDQLEAPPDVEVKLLDAFRARQVVRPFAARRSTSRYWLAAAVAAMLLIAISVIAYRVNRRMDGERQFAIHEQPQNTPKVKDEPSKQEQVVTDVRQQEQDVAPLIQKPRHVRHASVRRPENTQLANHVNTEIATDFIPLSYMTAANLQDGGQIVRVELPRSALAKFGLPVNMDRYNERVKADVLFGIDGLAHAIRFVH
ncbi:MAG TPA: hypothetical protein VIK76_20825 [Pyrinomonadaceae bacterium]|jgi:hypothetical protein